MLQEALPEVSLWCSQHPDENAVVSFLVDAWLALVQVTTAADALALLAAQPAEVRRWRRLWSPAGSRRPVNGFVASSRHPH
jgi:hypothetical protein